MNWTIYCRLKVQLQLKTTVAFVLLVTIMYVYIIHQVDMVHHGSRFQKHIHLNLTSLSFAYTFVDAKKELPDIYLFNPYLLEQGSKVTRNLEPCY